MTSDYRADLRTIVDALAPTSVLCIGPDCARVFGARAGMVTLAADGTLAARLTPLGRFDLAFVSALEQLDRRAALALLARLRDYHGGRVLVVVPEAPRTRDRSQWETRDLLGLGFIAAQRFTHDGQVYRLYTFDIATYKETPDWLNADYWAHPERWDKDWW